MGEVQLVGARGMPMCMKRKGGQCDEVPSLQMSVCSDCHTMEPGSLVWQSECMFGTL